MLLDNEHLQILADIESFAAIKKYRGMMPNRLTLFHQPDKLDELLQCGLVERVHVDMPCGAESRLFKLTDQGVEELERYRQSDEGQDFAKTSQPGAFSGLTRPQWILLNDIFHISQMHKNGGIAPNDELAAYDPADIQALYKGGLIVRVKAETGKGGKRKGLVLSRKGLQFVHDGEY